MTNKSWQKLTVTVASLDTQLIDWLSYLLLEIEAEGTEVNYAFGYLENHPDLFGEIPQEIPEELLNRDTEVVGYFSQERMIDLEAFELAVKEAVQSVLYRIKLSEIENENWQQNWMQHYEVQDVSRFVKIVPMWQEYEGLADERVIRLDPGLAFGTGNHPTTQLGVQGLEMFMRSGDRVLDVGTGSGILAFVALAFGASMVKGYDLDPQAIESAVQNMAYQKTADLSPLSFSVNDLLVGVKDEADVIVANILPHILVNMLDDAKVLLTDEGYLILGGILEEQGEKLEKVLKEKGWMIIQKTWLKGWLGYVTQKEREV
ncbi:50S ribosomal protein L11 methyltransferase [Fundicoccus sp. Sow4_F4]|uniref:50S ribosomal protein L11 methyltransferase n=1 Tax=Fundicoccus sp. Sow4_F4 TaxID=3438783 RepID=UPI003F8FF082